MLFGPLMHTFLVRPHQTPVIHHIGGQNRGDTAVSRHCSLGAFSSHTNLLSNSPKLYAHVNRASPLEGTQRVVMFSGTAKRVYRLA